MALTVFCPFHAEHGPCTRQAQCTNSLMCWYYQEMLKQAPQNLPDAAHDEQGGKK